jgi:hypothetical protein
MWLAEQEKPRIVQAQLTKLPMERQLCCSHHRRWALAIMLAACMSQGPATARGMALSDPTSVLTEGFKSPMRLSDIIRMPRGQPRGGLMMSDRRMVDVKTSVDSKVGLLRAMPGGVASPCKLGMRERPYWSEEAAQVRPRHPWEGHAACVAAASLVRQGKANSPPSCKQVNICHVSSMHAGLGVLRPNDPLSWAPAVNSVRIALRPRCQQPAAGLPVSIKTSIKH